MQNNRGCGGGSARPASTAQAQGAAAWSAASRTGGGRRNPAGLDNEEDDAEDALDEVSLKRTEDLTDAVATEAGDATLIPEVGADAAAIATTEVAETGGSEAAGVIAGVGAGLSATGIGIIIGAVVLLVDAAVTFTVLEENAVNAEYNQLLQLSQNADQNLPNMVQYIQDQTGAFKIQELWTEAMWPDAPASLVIPSSHGDRACHDHAGARPVADGFKSNISQLQGLGRH